MLRRWLALTYYLYALRLTALYHFYFNPLYNDGKGNPVIRINNIDFKKAACTPNIRSAGCFFVLRAYFTSCFNSPLA